MKNYLLSLISRACRMFMTIAKIMLPILFIVHFADQIGLVQWIATAIAPIMALLHLPAEAGIVWVTTIITNIYGGMAALGALSSENLQLTTAQLSALGAMMLFAHNLPVEQAIARRAGASAFVTGGLRISVAMIYGGLTAWLLSKMELLGTPVDLSWLSGKVQNPDSGFWASWWPWLVSTVRTLVMTALVIVSLVIILDVLDRIGFTKLVSRLLTPVLRLSGLDERVAPITTVGVLLGLAYGGALIIEEAETNNFDAKTRLLALSWLSLSHALIEDTLLILALGADIWVILVGRVLITLIIMALMGWTLRYITIKGPRVS